MAGGYIVTPDGRFIPADSAGPPIAQMQPDPSIVDAAQPVPDMRTANLDTAITGALAQGQPPSAIPGGTIGPISSGSAPVPRANIGDAAKIQQGLGIATGAGFGEGNPLDAGKPMDLRLVKAKVDAMNAPAQQQGGAAGGGPIFASPQASRGGAAAPSSGYVLREGRFIPHSRTIQSATPVSDETELNEKRALTNQMAAATMQGEHQAAAADEQAGQLGQMQTDLQTRAAADAQREAARQAASQAALDKYGQMQRAIESDQIDPKRIFRNQSDGEKFQTRMFMAMGALGASLTGGRNHYQDAFFKAIDDDVAAQNKALEGKRQNLADQRGMVAMMREHFGDERQADAAAKMAYLDMAKLKAEQMAASANSQAARDKALAFGADVQAKWAENQAALERSGIVHTQQVYQPAGVYGVGGKKPNEADVKHLDTELRKEKIPQAYSALDDLEGAIDTTGTGDIEGLGVVGQHVPDMLTSDKGIANRQAVEKAVLAVAHATGRVTPAEVDLVRQAAIRNGSARGLRNWVRSQRQELGNVDRSVRASVPQEAEQLYEQRGGLAPRDNSGPTAVRPAGE